MLPLYTDLSGKRIVVFGGGDVAERKICQILETGGGMEVEWDGKWRGRRKRGNARIEVYSIDFTPRIEEFCKKNEIRCFRCDLWDQNLEELLKGAFMILICTSDEPLNNRIFEEAEKSDTFMLINYKDNGNAFMSSVINKGGIVISISTGGEVPAMARYMKEKIAPLIGDKEEKMLYILAQLRDYLKETVKDETRRKKILSSVLSDSACWSTLDEPLPVEIAKNCIFKIVEERYRYRYR
ncbi:MAG: bifunctional precorrin-2 dehydrogenase/sirohydrochlorin ferrochelatase [Methanophagales archaeon]|nr:bifunctional precorrin-2 dehydrogenase/sirohydrochlorin ferrochelatase [Methanophagales archaeon]